MLYDVLESLYEEPRSTVWASPPEGRLEDFNVLGVIEKPFYFHGVLETIQLDRQRQRTLDSSS